MRIDSKTQSEELYVIRKQQEQVQEAAKATEQAQTQTQTVKVDEYDKANPVGEKAEGVYSVSHDESGNLKVDYKPTAKSEAKAESAKSAESSGSQQTGGSAPVTSSSSDDDDLEDLEEQRDILKAKLTRETDEATKQALRTQLQSIEMQIALKSAQ